MKSRLDRDDGFTLVELMVSIVVLGVLSSIVLVGVIQASRVFIHTDDENRGLQDARVILDRLATDIRQARGVVCDEAVGGGSRCANHVQLWIDDGGGDANYASNYVQEDQEVVTWELTAHADGEHFDVWRVQGLAESAPRRLQASALIVDTLFRYDAAEPEDATLVTLELKYDALADLGVEPRYASVSVRLRNKG